MLPSQLAAMPKKGLAGLVYPLFSPPSCELTARLPVAFAGKMLEEGSRIMGVTALSSLPFVMA
jgi:hypothetical protein